jgi:beta-N-acetylhexosaminidase
LGIGGDLNWPQTPIVDENTQPQQGASPQRRRERAPSEQRRAPEGAPSQTAAPVNPTPAVNDRPRDAAREPQRRPAPARARPSQPSEPATSSTRREQPPQSNEPDKEENAETETAAPDLPPPFPERASREAAVTPVSTGGAVNLAQTAPPAEADVRLSMIIGQLIMVGFEGVLPDDAASKAMAEQIKSGRIGGLLFTGRNIQSPSQIRNLTSAFRSINASTVPLLAVAQEGGALYTLSPQKGFQPYPPASELGAGNDPLKAYAIYQRMAAELSHYGFNMNLGPVLDVYHGDPKNISDAGGRSYGSQPKHVAAFAKAFRLAHAETGVLTVLKYFPFDAVDPAASVTSDPAHPVWEPADTEAYRQMTGNGNADAIMAGHFVDPTVSAEPGLPASLSPKAIQKLLREDIGYHGVVVSDDLDAAAVARFPLEDRVVRAIGAGVDILMFGDRAPAAPDLPERISAIIKNALSTGSLTRERLEESYARITALKHRLTGAGKALAAAKDEAPRPGPGSAP